MKTSLLYIGAFVMGVSVLAGCMEDQPAPDTPISTVTYQTQTVVTNLKAPWSVASLENGDVLITERGGALIHVNSQSERTEITELPDDIFVAGQAGLFDVVTHHRGNNQYDIYLSYARGTDAANGTAVYKAALDLNDVEQGLELTDGQILFTANPLKTGDAHYGGRMVRGDQGDIILSMGEGFQFREAAQDDDSDLGKIIRISTRGAKHISKGHRNVQGLALDPVTDVLWSHEHGPRGGDEVNIIAQGNNYGWPMVSYGLDYNGAKITPLTQMNGIEDPAYVWTPSIAPSGLAVYRGDMFAQWDGDLLIGGLASRDLRRLDVEEDRIIGETYLLREEKMRVRDVQVEKSGAVLVLLDDPEAGKLLRLSR